MHNGGRLISDPNDYSSLLIVVSPAQLIWIQPEVYVCVCVCVVDLGIFTLGAGFCKARTLTKGVFLAF